MMKWGMKGGHQLVFAKNLICMLRLETSRPRSNEVIEKIVLGEDIAFLASGGK